MARETRRWRMATRFFPWMALSEERRSETSLVRYYRNPGSSPLPHPHAKGGISQRPQRQGQKDRADVHPRELISSF
jgi:hypothetical protein